jgi:hypothetical protein
MANNPPYHLVAVFACRHCGHRTHVPGVDFPHQPHCVACGRPLPVTDLDRDLAETCRRHNTAPRTKRPWYARLVGG